MCGGQNRREANDRSGVAILFFLDIIFLLLMTSAKGSDHILFWFFLGTSVQIGVNKIGLVPTRWRGLCKILEGIAKCGSCRCQGVFRKG